MKTSWTHLLKTSSARLQCNNFSFSKICLEDVLKKCLEDVFNTSWRQTKCLLEISVSNKSKSVSNKSICHKSPIRYSENLVYWKVWKDKKIQELYAFFASKTLISNVRLKSGKIKQMLSNSRELNFCYLKIIHNLHPRYHPKTIGHALKGTLMQIWKYSCMFQFI